MKPSGARHVDCALCIIALALCAATGCKHTPPPVDGGDDTASESGGDVEREDGADPAVDGGVDAAVDHGADSSSDGAACPAPTSVPAGGVVIETGVVIGHADGRTTAFLGVPFAAPPVGALRFAPPAPAACLTTPLDAAHYGASCPQPLPDGSFSGAEDCLTLNVWVPHDASASSRKAVLVFIHGGGFVTGSANDEDGAALAASQDIVVVAIQYRLGALGYLAVPQLAAENAQHTEGNYGMLDQVAALAWVQRNIAAFGGDPAQVTLFGHSAGAFSVCALQVSPLAAGLFRATILGSGACDANALATAETNGQQVVSQLGCASAANVPACLRAAPATAYVAHQGAENAGNALRYGSAVDGYFLTAQPLALLASGTQGMLPSLRGNASAEEGLRLPTFASYATYQTAVTNLLTFAGAGASQLSAANAVYPTSSSGTADSWAQALVQMESDYGLVCRCQRDTAAAITGSAQAPLYRYVFSKIPDNATAAQQLAGTVHGLILDYVFGTFNTLDFTSITPGPQDLAVSTALQNAWGSFTRTGTLPTVGGSAWPTVGTDASNQNDVDIDTTWSMQSGYHAAQCAFWAPYL